ncbi:hypothetical protein ACEPAI_3862 [Sanghuangporus weigelae]
MAFFGSKSYERELKRSYSTDRFRRDRTTSTSTTNTTTTTQSHRHPKIKTTAPNVPGADEFGVVVPTSNNGGGKEKRKDDPPSLTFSTTSASTSLPSPNDPLTPVASPSLSVPVSIVNANGTTTRSSPSSSSSSLNKQPSASSTSARTRTVSASGSKHSSHSSSNPSRRRTPQLEVDDASSADAVAARVRRPSSGSGASKKGVSENVIPPRTSSTHSSSELKVEQSVSKSRSKASLRAQAANDGVAVIIAESGSSDVVPARPPRSVRPPDMQASSSKPSPSSAKGIASQKPTNSPATRSISSSPFTSSPFTGPSNTGLPLKQNASPSCPSGPISVSASTLRREDSSLSVPATTNHNNSMSKKSSCGNASDSSYGTPFSDFGVGGHGFSVKRLLSKPAASNPSISGMTGTGGGVRSEPDTSTTDSYDSYGAYALAARRRRVEGRSNAPEAPSSVYSLTGVSASTRDQLHARRPATSDPEQPPMQQRSLGSLGRARGLEWGHVLERERERERERGKAHVRESSSYSLSSPSEGAPGAAGSYPYGLAQERRASKHARPVIQLTTSAVRRLSALGARDSGSGSAGYERDRSHSPGTPMTFGPAPSPNPSPLTASSSRGASVSNIAGAGAPVSSSGRRTSSGQPSPIGLGSSVLARRAESPRPPVGLTPAEIVAHQYKEQERRRAELEREAARETEVPQKIHTASANANDANYELEYERSQRTVRVKQQEKEKEKEKEKDKEKDRLFRRASALGLPSPTSPTSRSSATKSEGKDGSQRRGAGEPLTTPYYTVFGEPTGRVVAIGSARDSAFGLFDRAGENRAKATEKAVVAELSGVTTAVSVTTTTNTTTTAATSSSSATAVGISDAGVGGRVSSSGERPPARSGTLRRKLSRKMSAGKFKADGNFTRGGGSGRESGKESSDGKENDKLEFGELLATGFGLGGGSSSSDWVGAEEWYSGTTFGSESLGLLRARPSLTLNMNTTSSSSSSTAAALPSATGRRSATLPREKGSGPQVKMSIDSYVAVQSIESASGRTLPSAANGVPSGFIGKARVKDEKDREKEKDKGKLWGLVKRISSNTLKDKYKRTSTDLVPPVPTLPRDAPSSSSQHTSPITLGDERSKLDEYAIQLGTPPSSRPPSRRPSTAPALNLGESPKEGRFATLRKKPSMSLAHPMQMQMQQQQQQQTTLLGTSPTHNTRPSVTTRSSSPMSSDLVFSYKQSDGSSVTSYGCDFTSTNSKLARGHPVLGEHILPPETLSMFDDLNLKFDLKKEDETRSKLESRNYADPYDCLFYTEEPMCHQALPVPPRRPPPAKAAETDSLDELRSESPTIPSFSADNAINAFANRKRPDAAGAGADAGAGAAGEGAAAGVAASAFTGTEFGTSAGRPSPPSSGSPASSVRGGATDPPPRPPRSALRVPPGSSNSIHYGHPPSPSLARAVCEDRVGRTSIGSHSQASTARPAPSITSANTNAHVLRFASSPCSTPSPPPPPDLLDSHQSPVSASDSASSTMTFRDISTTAAAAATSSSNSKQTLTEQEKMDKWNDLLDRSERAGGTLHVGVSGALLSDQLRESAYEYEPTIRDSLYDY